MKKSGEDYFDTVIGNQNCQLPTVVTMNDNTVKNGFWKKFNRIACLIPFAPELLSAYYCSIDPATPSRVRAILLAALAYFILPTDLIPDFIIGLGFSDDATVLTAAISIIAGHITDTHKAQAKATLSDLSDNAS